MSVATERKCQCLDNKYKNYLIEASSSDDCGNGL